MPWAEDLSLSFWSVCPLDAHTYELHRERFPRIPYIGDGLRKMAF